MSLNSCVIFLLDCLSYTRKPYRIKTKVSRRCQRPRHAIRSHHLLHQRPSDCVTRPLATSTHAKPSTLFQSCRVFERNSNNVIEELRNCSVISPSNSSYGIRKIIILQKIYERMTGVLLLSEFYWFWVLLKIQRT